MSKGILLRRATKAILIDTPPIEGEQVFALDTQEIGMLKNGVLTWSEFDKAPIITNNTTAASSVVEIPWQEFPPLASAGRNLIILGKPDETISTQGTETYTLVDDGSDKEYGYIPGLYEKGSVDTTTPTITMIFTDGGIVVFGFPEGTVVPDTLHFTVGDFTNTHADKSTDDGYDFYTMVNAATTDHTAIAAAVEAKTLILNVATSQVKKFNERSYTFINGSYNLINQHLTGLPNTAPSELMGSYGDTYYSPSAPPTVENVTDSLMLLDGGADAPDSFGYFGKIVSDAFNAPLKGTGHDTVVLYLAFSGDAGHRDIMFILKDGLQSFILNGITITTNEPSSVQGAFKLYTVAEAALTILTTAEFNTAFGTPQNNGTVVVTSQSLVSSHEKSFIKKDKWVSNTTRILTKEPTGDLISNDPEGTIYYIVE